ncbi:aggrecan core protein-like isoform X2 [Pomacea canaliculata]|uniref:aggrecan core protein-like isoform X2 n=1 Tax=Pomacea canaliculata TaxID=400727 RepID=UPI000D72B2E4|nr:aggrecan core protein-like isoform X2 [Pomacea canaliculata]
MAFEDARHSLLDSGEGNPKPEVNVKSWPWLAACLGVLLLFPHRLDTTLVTSTFYRKYYMDDKIITDPSTVVGSLYDVNSLLRCAMRCMTQEQCHTFFFVSQESFCQLHSVLFLGADEGTTKISSTYWQLTQEACPYSQGFILYRPLGLCYQYHFQKEHWATANATCSNQGTMLLKVDTESKFQHMYAFLRNSSATRLEHVSVGASRVSGTWRWQDGTDVTWFRWGSGEPSSSTEQCLTMAWFYFFQWNDVPCDVDPNAFYNFICQKLV